MKKKMKKILVFIIVLVIVLSISTMAYGQYDKDETIYGILEHDGSVNNIYVVNRLTQYRDNEYVDYGQYLEIKNLSTNTKPIIEGDKITFNEEKQLNSGLYYQGTIDKVLPYKIELEYYLDNIKMTGNTIVDKSGKVEIKLQISPELYCEKKIREGYMAQASISLELDNSSNIISSQSTNIIVGNTMTLTFVVLPGESGDFSIVFDTDKFALKPITISLIKSNITMPKGIKDNMATFDEGFDKLIDGMKELENGGEKLVGGISSLTGGINKLDEGLLQIAKNGSLFMGGLTQLESAYKNITEGSNDINVGIEQLAINGSNLSGGLIQLNKGTNELLTGHEQLVQLANMLSASNDPNVRALANGVIGEYEGIKKIDTSVSTLSYGMTEYINGLNMFKVKYEIFNSGLEQATNSFIKISNGMKAYINGVNTISSELDYLYDGITTLPEQVKQLSSGQSEMVTGLEKVKDEISKLTNYFETEKSDSISFVSSKNSPDLVQYILTTKEIKSEKIKEEIIEKEETQTFFEKIINLFKF